MDNNQNNNQTNPEAGERTFTQDEVNHIISERLGRDRDKRSAELDEREKAIKARELAVMAAEKLAAAELPKELADVLRYDDETSLDNAIQRLSSLRGFKAKNEKGDGYTIIPNKLPEGDPYPRNDYDMQLKKAFEVPKE